MVGEQGVKTAIRQQSGVSEGFASWYVAGLALSIRLSVAVLLSALNHFLAGSAFDTSHLIAQGSLSTGTRWDAIHFASVALKGYQNEQQTAFMPGFLGVMRIAGGAKALARRLLGQASSGGLTYTDVVQGGQIVNILASTLAAVVLYKCVRSTNSEVDHH